MVVLVIRMVEKREAAKLLLQVELEVELPVFWLLAFLG